MCLWLWLGCSKKPSYFVALAHYITLLTQFIIENVYICEVILQFEIFFLPFQWRSLAFRYPRKRVSTMHMTNVEPEPELQKWSFWRASDLFRSGYVCPIGELLWWSETCESKSEETNLRFHLGHTAAFMTGIHSDVISVKTLDHQQVTLSPLFSFVVSFVCDRIFLFLTDVRLSCVAVRLRGLSLTQPGPPVSSGCECTSGKSGLHKAFPFTAPPQTGPACAERPFSCTARLCLSAHVFLCCKAFNCIPLQSF